MRARLLKKIRKRFEILSYKDPYNDDKYVSRFRIKVADHKNKSIILYYGIDRFIEAMAHNFIGMFAYSYHQIRYRRRLEIINYKVEMRKR